MMTLLLLALHAGGNLPGPGKKLEIGQCLAIEVEDEAELSGRFLVQPDGRIVYSHKTGRIPCRGLTVSEVKADLERGLRVIIKKPIVSVELVARGVAH
jgi:protein involved in polysaccharide export with SLBB domain